PVPVPRADQGSREHHDAQAGAGRPGRRRHGRRRARGRRLREPVAEPGRRHMAGEIHLGALVESAYERRGGEETLIYEGRRIAASARLDALRRMTGGLVELGVRPGDRVVVCMANGPEVEVAYGAIWRAGAVVTPVVFLLSEAELRHVLVDSGAVAVVTSPELLPRVTAAAAGARDLRHVVVAGEAPADPRVVSYEDLVA